MYLKTITKKEEPEFILFLSKNINSKIISIQIYEDYVFVFTPHFLWFQHRYRFSKEQYNKWINEFANII